jgi:hypothetical protein
VRTFFLRSAVAVLFAVVLAQGDLLAWAHPLRWTGLLYNGVGSLLVLPLAALLAPFITSSRSVLRAALAAGCLVPLAAFAFSDGRGLLVPTGSFAVALVPLAVALRRSTEPCSRRLAVSCLVVGAVLPLAIASLLWWPLSDRLDPDPFRVWPTPQVIVGTACLVGALVGFASRSSKALFWLFFACAAFAISPSFGGFSWGCYRHPGPLGFLGAPRLVLFLALAPWVVPAARFMRRPAHVLSDERTGSRGEVDPWLARSRSSAPPSGRRRPSLPPSEP